ncbi:MAG: hypothetical protein S4CHLAM7_03150 [Chlamydiae bacterium]|nr:hypothetical protein [Chlamydiota bacterium]
MIVETLKKISLYWRCKNALKRECERLNNKLDRIQRETDQKLIAITDYLEDISRLLVTTKLASVRVKIQTKFPFAIESNDFKFPWGSSRDNTRHPRFVEACTSYFNSKKLSFLDLGCAGGGLVLDFLVAGHEAYGIDGSDFPLKNQQGVWKVIPNHLFNADLSKPFKLVNENNSIATFDIISAWELLEHIPENSVDLLIKQIKLHLNDGGLFIGSICFTSDLKDGHEYHATIQSNEWWLKKFSDQGFEILENVFSIKDFPRGSSNPRVTDDYNVLEAPSEHSHLVAKLKL